MKMHPLDHRPSAAPGPFYIQANCCTACMAPHAEAPELFGMDQATGECFFARQPADARQVYLALKAVAVAELDCIRYGGSDERVLRRFARLGSLSQCDYAAPADADTTPRTHVSFAASFAADAWDVSRALRESIAGRRWYGGYETHAPVADRGEVRIDLEWHGQGVRSIWIAADPRTPGRWVVRHLPLGGMPDVGVALGVDDWLRDDPRFTDLQWYTAAEWETGRDTWFPWPF